jgi:hypothetical protein
MTFTPTTRKLLADSQDPGSGVLMQWLSCLDTGDLEIHITEENALVLVDRSPLIREDGAAFLRKAISGPGSIELSRVGELNSVSDDVLHGVYSGLIDGTAVMLDQYVKLRNGVPVTLVRVIARLNAAESGGRIEQDRLVAKLMG